MHVIMKGIASVVLAKLLICGAPVFATSITGQGNPLDAIPGGTVVNFDSGPAGTYNAPVTVDSVSFAANGNFYITGDYIGDYNTRGVYSLQTRGNEGDATSFTITLPSSVSAVAFLFGASDVTWVLTAYDANNNVLDSLSMTPTHGSNAGDYFGIQAPGIKYITIASESSDYVMLDDLTFSAVVPRELKQQAADNLMNDLPTGDGVIDMRFASAIGNIRLSLASRLWVDDSHLVRKGGSDVFSYEAKAIRDLEWVLKDRAADPGLQDDAQSAIDDLLSADDALAQTTIADANAAAGGIPKAARELSAAAKDYAKAAAAAAAGRHIPALQGFQSAWTHAQKALQYVP